VLLALRTHDSNLTHPERLDRLRPPPRTQPPDLRHVHKYAATRRRDEVHRRQHGAVVAVLEVGPYAALGVAYAVEAIWRRAGRRAPRQRADEARTKEDRQNTQVLCGVGYGYVLVARPEGVLDMRAEIMGQWHGLKSRKKKQDGLVWLMSNVGERVL
jgi:hypothetical protein